MRILSSALAMALALLATGKLLAADPAQPDSSPPKRAPRFGAGGLDFLQGLELTDDQKAKLASLKQEFLPKFKETSEKMAAIYTDEQKAAIREAAKAARAAGKSFQEMRKVMEDAAKPTPEQQTKIDAIRKDIEGVQKELREKVTAILTPEQREMVEKKMKEKAAAGDPKKPADSSK
jgi:Spy/CpxP family protein refolding chaperone